MKGTSTRREGEERGRRGGGEGGEREALTTESGDVPRSWVHTSHACTERQAVQYAPSRSVALSFSVSLCSPITFRLFSGHTQNVQTF
jgi:hypothetical protein